MTMNSGVTFAQTYNLVHSIALSGTQIPGSWPDKLIEAFSGTHDMIGGKLSGLYDEQGNTRRDMSDTERKTYDYAISPVAIIPSAPFAIAEYLSPEMWKAISILLGAAK